MDVIIFILSCIGTYLLGAIFGFPFNKKYVGQINIGESEEGKKTYFLDLNCEPEELDQHKEVTFKIGSAQPQ